MRTNCYESQWYPRGRFASTENQRKQKKWSRRCHVRLSRVEDFHRLHRSFSAPGSCSISTSGPLDPPPPTAPASRLNVRLREGSKPRSFPADTSAARAGVEREKKVDVPGGTTLENLIMFFSDTMRETRWWSGGQRKSFYLTSLHLARCGLGEKKHK